MEELIKELRKGNDKELREHFFEIMRDLEKRSLNGEIAWAEVEERTTQEINFHNEIADKYWLR